MFRAKASATSNIRDKHGYDEFDTRQPVRISKRTEVLESRFMEYACLDLASLQRRIHEHPFNKDAVISEIDETLKWRKWFKPAPPEIQRLMDGFRALKEALSKDPRSLAASIAAERDKAHQRVDGIEVSQASISTAHYYNP